MKAQNRYIYIHACLFVVLDSAHTTQNAHAQPQLRLSVFSGPLWWSRSSLLSPLLSLSLCPLPLVFGEGLVFYLAGESFD